jgi:hypothetical protein
MIKWPPPMSVRVVWDGLAAQTDKGNRHNADARAV